MRTAMVYNCLKGHFEISLKGDLQGQVKCQIWEKNIFFFLFIAKFQRMCDI